MPEMTDAEIDDMFYNLLALVELSEPWWRGVWMGVIFESLYQGEVAGAVGEGKEPPDRARWLCAFYFDMGRVDRQREMFQEAELVIAQAESRGLTVHSHSMDELPEVLEKIRQATGGKQPGSH